MGLPFLQGFGKVVLCSPLLFAIVADLLLRCIQRLLPSALPRAYADDLLVVAASIMMLTVCFEL